MLPLLIVATTDEQRLVEKYLPEYPVVHTGVGASNIIRTCYDIPRDTPVINIGFAGSNNLPIGRVCLVSRSWRVRDDKFQFEDYRHGYELSVEGFPCYTGNEFVTETDKTEPTLFDMELNYIVAFPFRHLGAIKIVSDHLSLETYEETIVKSEDDVWKEVRALVEKLAQDANTHF